MARKKIKFFEDKARTTVGDGKSPNLYFVTTYDERSGAVVGIVRSLQDAKDVAKNYNGPVMVEDRQTGVVWENEASLRFQREADRAELEANPRHATSDSELTKRLKF